MKKSLIIGFLFFSIIVKGQNLFPEKFDNCNSEMFFLEGREIYSKSDNEILLFDIVNNIDKRTLKKLRGEVLLQVKIDTLGIPCCISLKSNFSTMPETINFKQIIDNYTTWTPPIKENKKTTVCAILKLTFLKKKIMIKRLGYNTKVGLVELSSYQINK